MNNLKNPVLEVTSSMLIKAPIDRVWHLQTDIDNWSIWQKDVTKSNLEGALTPGSIFRWKAMGMSIVSTIDMVEKNKSIVWSGHSIGMSALHKWKFIQDGNNTQVTTTEFLSGWFPKILKFFDPTFLNKSLTRALEKLKNESEK